MQQLIVQFESELDDAEMDENDEVRVPGGRTIALQIADSLSRTDYLVSSVSQRSFYGWEFEIKDKDCSYLAVVQLAEVWMIVIGEFQSIFRKFWNRRDDKPIRRLASKVASIIQDNGIGKNPQIVDPYTSRRPE